MIELYMLFQMGDFFAHTGKGFRKVGFLAGFSKEKPGMNFQTKALVGRVVCNID